MFLLTSDILVLTNENLYENHSKRKFTKWPVKTLDKMCDVAVAISKKR